MKSMFLVLLLLIAGCSSQTGGGSAAPISSGSSPASGSPSGGAAMAIHVKDFALDPKVVTSAGSGVVLAVTNDGPTIHNVTIRDSSGTVRGATRDLKPGQSETLSAQLPAGTYVLYCSLPGHESLGIKGTLTVAP